MNLFPPLQKQYSLSLEVETPHQNRAKSELGAMICLVYFVSPSIKTVIPPTATDASDNSSVVTVDGSRNAFTSPHLLTGTKKHLPFASNIIDFIWRRILSQTVEQCGVDRVWEKRGDLEMAEQKLHSTTTGGIKSPPWRFYSTGERSAYVLWEWKVKKRGNSGSVFDSRSESRSSRSILIPLMELIWGQMWLKIPIYSRELPMNSLVTISADYTDLSLWCRFLVAPLETESLLRHPRKKARTSSIHVDHHPQNRDSAKQTNHKTNQLKKRQYLDCTWYLQSAKSQKSTSNCICQRNGKRALLFENSCWIFSDSRNASTKTFNKRCWRGQEL